MTFGQSLQYASILETHVLSHMCVCVSFWEKENVVFVLTCGMVEGGM